MKYESRPSEQPVTANDEWPCEGCHHMQRCIDHRLSCSDYRYFLDNGVPLQYDPEWRNPTKEERIKMDNPISRLREDERVMVFNDALSLMKKVEVIDG